MSVNHQEDRVIGLIDAQRARERRGKAPSQPIVINAPAPVLAFRAEGVTNG